MIFKHRYTKKLLKWQTPAFLSSSEIKFQVGVSQSLSSVFSLIMSNIIFPFQQFPNTGFDKYLSHSDLNWNKKTATKTLQFPIIRI